jgi:hypothetical protein
MRTAGSRGETEAQPTSTLLRSKEERGPLEFFVSSVRSTPNPTSFLVTLTLDYRAWD